MRHRILKETPSALLAAVAMLVLSSSAWADGDAAPIEKPAATEKVTDKGADDSAGDDAGLGAARFMPLGKPNRMVKIPQFKDGILECVMRAAEMTRIDDDKIDIKTMDIDFMEDGEPAMNIALQDATYSLEDKLISSENRAVIKRADFTLVGDSLDFDTASRQGRMTGKVRMVIHDSKGFMEEGDEESQKEAAAQAAATAEARADSPWVGGVAGGIADAMLASEQEGGNGSREGGGDE